MSRYRSHRSAKVIEQYFLHFVEIAVPPNGLGATPGPTYDSHARHGVAKAWFSFRHDANGSVIRSCFGDPDLAAAFASEFGQDRR
jgi:hypothetical protein